MKINKLLLYLLVAIAMVLPLASGCINKSPIDQAVICQAVSKAGEPLMVADNLTPDVKTIYCSIKLAAVQPKSIVKAEWYLVKSAEAGLTDTLIGAGTVAAETPYVVCSFARAEALLPRGEYQIKLYFDNKFVQSVPFQVQGEPATSAATLSEATLCSSVDILTEKPIVSVSIFPNDASSIYCSVKVSGAQFNDQVKARWTYVVGELEGFQGKTVAERSSKVEGREYVYFSFGPKEGQPFPKGDYSLGLYVNDRELVKLPFTVVAPADLKGPYVGEMAIFTYKDKEKKEVNTSAVFTTDMSEVDFQIKIYNAPADTEMNVQWIITRSDDAGLMDYLVNEDKNKIEGTMLQTAKMISVKDKFVKGDYVVKLLLDGQEKAAVPFKVQ